MLRSEEWFRGAAIARKHQSGLSQIKTLSRSAETSMSQTPTTSIEQTTRVTQIIMGGLIAGLTAFLLVVVFLVHFVGLGAAPAPSIPILTYVAAGMAAILLPLSFILPGYIAAQSLRPGATGHAEGRSSPSKNPAASPGQAVTPANVFQTAPSSAGRSTKPRGSWRELLTCSSKPPSHSG